MITHLLLPALAGKFTFESFALQRLALTTSLATLKLGLPLQARRLTTHTHRRNRTADSARCGLAGLHYELPGWHY